MGVMTYLPLALLAACVLVPLGREYSDLRQSWGLARWASAATTLLVLPSLGVGLAVGVNVADAFGAQWATTIVVTLVLYSLAASAVRNALVPARSPRRSG